MNKYLVLILTIITVNIFAQSAVVSLSSPAYKKPKKSQIVKYIGEKNGGYYFLRDRGGNSFDLNKRKAILEYFDSNLKLVKSMELNLEYKGKNLTIEDAIITKTGLFAIYSFFNRSQKTKFLFAQQYDLEKLKESSDLIKISQQEKSNLEESSFGIKMSKDSSNILIVSHPTNNNDEQSIEFGLNVYNQNFEKIWEKEEVLKYNLSAYSIEQFVVDNNSNVYVIGQLYEKRTKKDAVYNYTIMTYTNLGSKYNEFDIKQRERYLNNLNINISKKGEVVCSGYYSDKSINTSKGIFYFILDPINGNISNQNFEPFNFSIRSENLSDRKIKKALEAEKKENVSDIVELSDYNLKDFRLRSDNGGLLISEQEYTRMDGGYYNNNFNNPFGFNNFGAGFNNPWGFNNNVNNYVPTVITQHSDNILISNIDPEGKIVWTQKIVKQQELIETLIDNTSYLFGITNDNVVVLFNGKNPNINQKYEKPTIAFINKMGDTSYESLENKAFDKFMILPKLSKQIGSASYLIYSENKSEFKLSILKINTSAEKK